MTESIIIIDTSDIREGKLGELKKAMSGLVGLAEANEPRVIAYGMYLNGDGTGLTVIQVLPDSVSAEFHMKIAGSAFPRFVEFIRMSGIDIYGKPSREMLEMLQRKKPGCWAAGRFPCTNSKQGSPGSVSHSPFPR